MISRRTTPFWKCFKGLPENIQALAKEKFNIWKNNPEYPSLRFQPIESTKDNPFPKYEISITLRYRAVCFKDGDTYVWEWIGTHEDFNKLY